MSGNKHKQQDHIQFQMKQDVNYSKCNQTNKILDIIALKLAILNGFRVRFYTTKKNYPSTKYVIV